MVCKNNLTILKQSGKTHIGYEVNIDETADPDKQVDVTVVRDYIGEFEEDCNTNHVFMSFDWIEQIYKDMCKERGMIKLRSLTTLLKAEIPDMFVKAELLDQNNYRLINVILKDIKPHTIYDLYGIYFDWMKDNNFDFIEVSFNIWKEN